MWPSRGVLIARRSQLLFTTVARWG